MIKYSQVNIRTVETNDVPSIMNIIDQCFDPSEETYWGHDDLVHALQQENQFLWLLEYQANILGFLITQQVLDEAEILLIATAPDHREKGLGKALFKGWLRHQAGNGALKNIFLEVAADNYPALKFYQALSFKQVGLRKAYYKKPDGLRVDALLLARQFCLEKEVE